MGNHYNDHCYIYGTKDLKAGSHLISWAKDMHTSPSYWWTWIILLVCLFECNGPDDPYFSKDPMKTS